VFVPVLAAHRIDSQSLRTAALAFAAFCLCASGGYIFNDLLDAESDRQHARKRSRPLASSAISTSVAIAVLAVLWLAGFAIAFVWLPRSFLAIAAIYLAATVLYSARLKREAVLDVIVLAGLYVIRVVAGGAAGDIAISTWLLAFTLFLSLSLAFLKRFVEVHERKSQGFDAVPGRGYRSDDAAWLHSAGLLSSYLAVVILAIYANNADIARLYSKPERLLLICPLLLYWSTRTWLKAHRRQIHDDPVVAVASDPASYVIAVLAAAAVLSAV
jgi:4-hydroxybenzoate polyprenyltransferase